MSTGKKIFLAIVGLTVLMAIGGATSSSTHAVTTPPVHPAQTTVPPLTSTTLSEKAAVTAWLGSNAIHTGLLAVFRDMSNLQSAGSHGSVSQAAAACAQMSTDVGTLQMDQTPPSPAVNSTWEAMLNDYQIGASDCSNGISSGDQQTMQSAINYAASASSLLAQIVGQMKSLK